jgi:hypothetical protein
MERVMGIESTGDIARFESWRFKRGWLLRAIIV